MKTLFIVCLADSTDIRNAEKADEVDAVFIDRIYGCSVCGFPLINGYGFPSHSKVFAAAKAD